MWSSSQRLEKLIQYERFKKLYHLMICTLPMNLNYTDTQG